MNYELRVRWHGLRIGGMEGIYRKIQLRIMNYGLGDTNYGLVVRRGDIEKRGEYHIRLFYGVEIYECY